MHPPLRVLDGTKCAIFDGLVLEVLGVNGSTDSKRLAINTLEKVGVAAAGDEWLFLVKTLKGGFSIAISLEKKAEWEKLVEEVMNARAALVGT